MLKTLLNDFGYYALFFGTFFEGETILVLAGFLAFRGYMKLETVIITAFFGSYAGDQLWYFIGRHFGPTFLKTKPKLETMTDKAMKYLRKNTDIWVLVFRFIYGLRTIMPIAIGMSGYPPTRYLILNGCGAIIWANIVGLAAYYFSNILERILGNIKKYELIVIGLLIFIVLCVWGWRRIRRY